MYTFVIGKVDKVITTNRFDITKIYKNRHIVTTKGQKLFRGTQIGIDKLN
jgi:hypothetical protein